jgi:hypothetical protein
MWTIHVNNTVALCESRRQVKWLLANPNVVSEKATFVALNPDAAWALRKAGITYARPEDYYSPRDLMEQAEGILTAQVQWAKWVDHWLQYAIPEFQSVRFRPARYYLFPIKSVWDTLLHRAYVLESLAARARPDRVVYFEPRQVESFTLYPQLQTSTYSLLIPIWAMRYQIEQLPLPILPGDNWWAQQVDMQPSNIWRRLFKRVLPMPLQMLAKHYYARLMEANSFEKSTVQGALPDGSLIWRRSYDFNADLALELAKRSFRVKSFDGVLEQVNRQSVSTKEICQRLGNLWSVVAAEPAFWQPTGSQDWSLREALAPILRYWWMELIPQQWKAFVGARRVLGDERPRGVLIGTCSKLDESALLMAAHSLDVPVVFYQHGACMGDMENQQWDVLDIFLADYMLVYAEGEAEAIQERTRIFDDARARPVATGSTRLDAVRARMCLSKSDLIRQSVNRGKHKPIVLYVPSFFYHNCYRIGPASPSDVSVMELRARIATFFASHQEVSLVYKAFESFGRDPTLEMVSERCPRASIVQDIPLTDLMWAADLLIYEYPSTGMFEGLLTRKRMIVYADRDFVYLKAEAKELLNRRVSLAESPEEMVRAIQCLVEAGDFSQLELPDEGYFNRYVAYRNDGHSAKRAADALAEIMQTWTF